jgi:SSS family solute:Na+ symporter
VGLAYLIALMRPALIVYILLMAYSFTAQLFPATIAAFYTRIRTGTPILIGLIAGFATAMVFVSNLVKSPFNIHPGILGLAVNLAVLAAATYLLRSSATAHPQKSTFQQ